MASPAFVVHPAQLVPRAPLVFVGRPEQKVLQAKKATKVSEGTLVLREFLVMLVLSGLADHPV